ncbi:MAG: prepilin-type N-terminal cleavage/methylation domain-containing protein [Rickettsiales bacterium]
MNDNRGFTLLEVSIVIVIVGLLIGGIVVGKNLIRSSEIKSVGEDVEKYSAAITLFKTQYTALPGDMKNATQFWGAVAGAVGIGSDATCDAYFDATQTPRTLTCNGNGNGRLEAPNQYWYEVWYAWQHLSNAELIQGQYSGQGKAAPGSGINMVAIPGVNAPLSKVHSLTYAILSEGTVNNPADSQRYVGAYGNVIRIGGVTEVDDIILTPAESYEIDAKIDDGLPGTGLLRGYKPNKRPNCTTTSDPTTATYQVTYEGIACNLLYLINP